MRMDEARRRRVRLTGIAVVGLGLPTALQAQALPFHAETGITTGFEEAAARTFAGFAGRSGLRLDGAPTADPMRRDIDVFIQPLAILPYAFTPMWTTRLILPFVRKTMTFEGIDGVRRSYTGSGVGDALVDMKWIFFSRNRLGGTLRAGVAGGIKIPLGGTRKLLPDGTVAPRPLQPGTGSWDVPLKALFTLVRGRYGIVANGGYRVNTAADGFEAGDVFSYDLATGLRLLPGTYESIDDDTFLLYLELNGSVTRESAVAGVTDPNSGGHLLFVSPDLQWIPTPWVLVEASIQIPLVQDLNGAQLGYDTRFQIGSRVRFSFLR